MPTEGFWYCYKGAQKCLLSCHTHHHVLSAEDDPKRQQHGIENALSNVSKEQHPSPVKSDGKPLHWDVNECHGNSQSKDDPAETETPSLSSLQGGDLEPESELFPARDKKTPHWAAAADCQGGTQLLWGKCSYSFSEGFV